MTPAPVGYGADARGIHGRHGTTGAVRDWCGGSLKDDASLLAVERVV